MYECDVFDQCRVQNTRAACQMKFKYSGLALLFYRNYIESLAEEINDRLQENGTVTIAELAKAYDLPGDFIKQVCFSVVNNCKINLN